MRKIINGLLAQFGYQIRASHAPLQSFDKGLQALALLISVNSLIDVGVALGTPELYRAFPHVQLLLIEANPRFKDTLDRLGRELNAKVEMAFCGPLPGEIQIWDANQSSSSIYERPGTKKISVPVQTLDFLVEKNGMRGSTVIKIDVEGAEIGVLAGSTRILSDTKAVIIEVAWGRKGKGNNYLEILNFMEEHGFTLFNIVEGGGIREHKRLTHADFIFVRR